MVKFRFETLEIWKAAVEYGIKIYLLANKFPKQEIFGLISQLKRAAASISSNIAEGSGSSSTADFKHFLDIAIKSTLETVSQPLFAVKLGYVTEAETESMHEEAEVLIKRIHSFKKSLK